MAKPSTNISSFDVGSDHSATQHGGGLPAPDDSGNVDDPPPIPSASSSSVNSLYLGPDDNADGARGTKTNSSFVTVDDKDSSINVHKNAHTLSPESVAVLLGTDIQ